MKQVGWVRCLNCGYEYYLEQYANDNFTCCPVCFSKEFELSDSKKRSRKCK